MNLSHPRPCAAETVVEDDSPSIEIQHQISTGSQFDAAQSTDNFPQSSCSLPDRRQISGCSRKRSQSTSSQYTEKNQGQDDLSVQSSSSEESGNESWVGGIAVDSVSNEHSTIGKRQCLQRIGNIACTSNSPALTSVLDGNAIDLQIEDGLTVKVSKSVLKEVPYFSKLFSKEWDQLEHSLLGDDAFALRVVLTVLHHKPHLLPSSMSTWQLFDLATVCDKYNVVDIVSPYVESGKWIAALWENNKPCDGVWEPWLWILFVFRSKGERAVPRYGMILDVLAANMSFRDGSWIITKGSHICQVSDITSPNKLDPLHETLERRRNAIWDALKNRGYKERRTLLVKTKQDFYAIGSLVAFLESLPPKLFGELSLVERLRMLRRKGWPARPGVVAFVDPWIDIYAV